MSYRFNFLTPASILVISFLLLSCKTTTSPVSENKAPVLTYPDFLGEKVFGSPIKIIKPSDILQLNPAQQAHFFQFFHSTQQQEIAENMRIYNYLESHLHNYNYYHETLIASQSLIQNKGNCLSLAIVTKALADLVDVKISYKLVETEPVFQKEDNLVISSQHVRTQLYEKQKDEGKLFPSSITVDYFPDTNARTLRAVDENEFFSMYYRNIAAQALIDNELNSAYWNIRAALDLKRNDSEALNMMALLHKRTGYISHAENIYQYAIKAGEDKLSALNNYHSLLLSLGKTGKAQEIESELEKYNDPNPFIWLSIGNSAYNNGNYRKAIRYYNKAKNLAPYMHDIYAAIARSEYQLGNLNKAKKTLTIAKEKSHQQKTKLIYLKKIEMLDRLLSNKKSVITKQ